MSYLPLTELRRSDDTHINWQVAANLNVDESRVVMDVGRAGSLLRLAGFGSLTVEQYMGGPPEDQVAGMGVAGISSDGALTGMFIGSLARVKRANAKINTDRMPAPYAWPEGVVSLDRTVLGQTVSHVARRHPDADPTHTWANALNTAFRQGLFKLYRRKAVERLSLGREDPIGTVADWIVLDVAGVGILHSFITSSAYPLLGAATIGASVFAGSHAWQYKGASWMDSQKRWYDRRVSLLPGGSDLDRLALAAVWTAASRQLIGIKKPDA